MKRVLITGGSGFIVHNLCDLLQEKYEIMAPTHCELNVMEFHDLSRYIRKKRVDIVIHAANHARRIYGIERELSNDLRMFMNLQKLSGDLEKVLYFGSGAEYDKRYDISMVKETDIGNRIPVSEYGIAKYIMNELARTSKNIYNLRLFGVFGKYELWDVRFLSNLCCKAIFDLPLTVRRECAFDFLYVNDLAQIVEWAVENSPKYHDYNVCMGKPYMLTELAKIVLKISGSAQDIVLLNGGRDPEYTADHRRLLDEFPEWKITPIQNAIESLYHYYEKNRNSIDFARLRDSK